MRSSMLLRYSILPVLMVLALGGCRSLISKPHPMPRGYTPMQQEYKTPPPAKADDIGYEYSEEKNQQVIEIWRPKVEELVSRIEAESGLQNADFYIRVPLETDAQMATFDHVLRETLEERGHTIISDHYAGIILTYNIFDPDTLAEEDRARYSYNDTLDQPDNPYFNEHGDYAPMVIEMAAYDQTTPVASVSGIYTVPMYGFEVYDIPGFWAPIAGQESIGRYDKREKRFNE